MTTYTKAIIALAALIGLLIYSKNFAPHSKLSDKEVKQYETNQELKKEVDIDSWQEKMKTLADYNNQIEKVKKSISVFEDMKRTEHKMGRDTKRLEDLTEIEKAHLQKLEAERTEYIQTQKTKQKRITDATK
jgi:multidrug efflux pump subunit AcrB